jgi:hypothetical protein
MVAAPETLMPQPGWLRSKGFDITFVLGIAAIAFLSGLIVLIDPDLFRWVLVLDLWLLGYHHVISTFSRLAFDRKSLHDNRFFVFVLPFIIFATTFVAAWSIGAWIITSVYLYWQWFHYTRQSWGISQVYRAKSGGLVTDSPLYSRLCFYLIPAWGILNRSWQAPDKFLFIDLRVIPVPELLVNVVGVAAIASVFIWGFQRIQLWRAGRLPVAHTGYMLSHFLVFYTGYIWIEDITFGWLVINIWHNAQYILFVWLFNTNRFKNGIDVKAKFLSEISQPRNIVRYMLICLAFSSIIYVFAAVLTANQQLFGVPLAILIYQTINFHHYVVDSLIWKVRKKTMQKNLELNRT